MKWKLLVHMPIYCPSIIFNMGVHVIGKAEVRQKARIKYLLVSHWKSKLLISSTYKPYNEAGTFILLLQTYWVRGYGNITDLLSFWVRECGKVTDLLGWRLWKLYRPIGLENVEKLLACWVRGCRNFIDLLGYGMWKCYWSWVIGCGNVSEPVMP